MLFSNNPNIEGRIKKINKKDKKTPANTGKFIIHCELDHTYKIT